MIQRARPISLNLLPQDPFYSTLPGRVLMWASTVGRYLVIFTELVVIISFATRFKLDRDLTDLNSKISQKAALIQSYGDLEERVRTIQKKTDLLAQESKDISSPQVLAIVSKSLPKDIVLESIQFQDGAASFNGTSLSSVSLAQYILTLQANPNVKAVAVNEIKSAENGVAGFSFIMRITVNDTPKPAAAPVPAQPTEDTQL